MFTTVRRAWLIVQASHSCHRDTQQWGATAGCPPQLQVWFTAQGGHSLLLLCIRLSCLNSDSSNIWCREGTGLWGARRGADKAEGKVYFPLCELLQAVRTCKFQSSSHVMNIWGGTMLMIKTYCRLFWAFQALSACNLSGRKGIAFTKGFRVSQTFLSPFLLFNIIRLLPCSWLL